MRGHDVRRVVLIAAVVATGCDRAAEVGEAAEVAETIQDQMDRAMKAAGVPDGAKTQVVSAEDLQARLPEEVDGLARTDVSRQETGAMGFNVSTTQAEYRGDDGRRVEITIADMGAAGLMAAAGAAWATVDFDRTVSGGYERTTRFKGLKAVEKVRRQGDRLETELAVLVGDRIIVTLRGRDVRLEELKKALEEIDPGWLVSGR